MKDNPYAPPLPTPLGYGAVPISPGAAAPSPAAGRTDFGNALVKSIHPCTALRRLGIAPREKVLADWFAEGDLGFVFAPRGLGKTWLSLALATAIAAGKACGPWQAAQPRRVLYVDGEMPCESLHERIAGMGGVENLTVLNHEALFHLGGEVLNLGSAVVQAELTARLLEDGVKVIFLDNLSCLFSGVKENDADSWENVLSWLLTLRRHRIAVVVVHHSGRNKEMRGTSRREDAAFWVIRLEAVSAEGVEGACFISRFTKERNSGKEQPAIEWTFRTESGGQVVIDTKPAEGLDVFRQWIVDGLTSAEDIAREMDLSKGMVSRLAKRAMEAGWLGKNGREYVLV